MPLHCLPVVPSAHPCRQLRSTLAFQYTFPPSKTYRCSQRSIYTMYSFCTGLYVRLYFLCRSHSPLPSSLTRLNSRSRLNPGTDWQRRRNVVLDKTATLHGNGSRPGGHSRLMAPWVHNTFETTSPLFPFRPLKYEQHDAAHYPHHHARSRAMPPHKRFWTAIQDRAAGHPLTPESTLSAQMVRATGAAAAQQCGVPS